MWSESLIWALRSLYIMEDRGAERAGFRTEIAV